MGKEIDCYWSGDGQAYIMGDKAFVLTSDLRTIRIDKANLEKSGKENKLATAYPRRSRIQNWRGKLTSDIKRRLTEFK
jgi:hypothetical protein